MYFGGPTPVLSGDLPEALDQLIEIAKIACSQLEVLEKDPEKTQIIGVLDRLDDMLEIFRQNIIPLTPLLDDFKCRKENVPPVSREEIFSQTRRCYEELRLRAMALRPLKKEKVLYEKHG
jgi:hypothetical protein